MVERASPAPSFETITFVHWPRGPSPKDCTEPAAESPPLVEEDEALKETESGPAHEPHAADDFPSNSVLVRTEHPGPSPYPSTLMSPRAVSLLLHFSDHIAGDMIAIDGMHNGWRHLVLPIAHTEALVLNAVLAASSFHVAAKQRAEARGPEDVQTAVSRRSANRSAPQSDAEAVQFYYHTITELQKWQDFASYDVFTKLSVLLTVLVLLVAVMVTASDDFPRLFGLLEAALAAMGGEASLGKSELSSFILRQIHKMRVYAAPLLSEKAGIATLSSEDHVARSFDCLRHCLQQRPGYSEIASVIESLGQQSRDIYLHQAMRKSCHLNPALLHWLDAESVSRIQRFKETLAVFPPDAPGAQVLIWATFMAAPDCVLPEHQAFFTKVLRQYYKRSGFENVLRGLEHLEGIWQRRSDARDSWTSLLPQAKVFVM